MELGVDYTKKSKSSKLICKALADLASSYSIDFILSPEDEKDQKIKDLSLQTFERAINLYHSNPKEAGDYIHEFKGS